MEIIIIIKKKKNGRQKKQRRTWIGKLKAPEKEEVNYLIRPGPSTGRKANEDKSF